MPIPHPPSHTSIFKSIADIVSFTSNATTTIIGLAALYGLIFRRKELKELRLEIKGFLSAFADFKFYERSKKIIETLNRLDQLILNKDATLQIREEALALMGQLNGQVKSLIPDRPSLTDIQGRIQIIVEKKRFTEPQKREICHELRGLLDNEAASALSPKVEVK